jgi:HEPN domain-containing protein
MALDPVRVANTREWLTKAGDDLRAAEIDLAAAPPLLGDLAFHCQQAIEKALKAYLTWHDIPFRRTHDLTGIGRQCVDIDPTLEPLVRRTTPLSEYAWRFRYPGDEAGPTPE